MSDLSLVNNFVQNMRAMTELFSEHQDPSLGQQDSLSNLGSTNHLSSHSSIPPNKYFMVTIYSIRGESISDLTEEESDIFHSELSAAGNPQLSIAWANYAKDGRYVLAASNRYTEEWLLQNTPEFTHGTFGAIPSNKYHLLRQLRLWKVLIPRYLIEDDPEELLSKIFESAGLATTRVELVDFVYPEESGKKELELVIFMEDSEEATLLQWFGKSRFYHRFELKYGMYWLTFKRVVMDESPRGSMSN